jgi:hypothetical protein
LCVKLRFQLFTDGRYVLRRDSALQAHSIERRPGATAVSQAADHAAGILEAWSSSDKERLAAALSEAAAPAATPPPDWHEGERAELLAEAVADLRAMLAFTSAQGAAVPLRLLQHLAAR